MTLFDAAAVSQRACPWFERVASAANISDEVSRMDFRRAEEDGWTHCAFDFEGIWSLLDEALGVPQGDLPRVAADLCVAARCQGAVD